MYYDWIDESGLGGYNFKSMVDAIHFFENLTEIRGYDREIEDGEEVEYDLGLYDDDDNLISEEKILTKFVRENSDYKEHSIYYKGGVL